MVQTEAFLQQLAPFYHSNLNLWIFFNYFLGFLKQLLSIDLIPSWVGQLSSFYFTIS